MIKTSDFPYPVLRSDKSVLTSYKREYYLNINCDDPINNENEYNIKGILINQMNNYCSGIMQETRDLMEIMNNTPEWNDNQTKAFRNNVVELTKDLKAPVGEPRLFFHASDAIPAVASFHHPRKGDIYVTDGPFLFRDKEDKLRMIWSSFAKENQYCVALASPECGAFSDEWKPERNLLFAKDGGHGMIFTGLDGKRYLALHSPNETLAERPFFYEVDL